MNVTQNEEFGRMEIGSILIYTAFFAALLSIIFTLKNRLLPLLMHQYPNHYKTSPLEDDKQENEEKKDYEGNKKSKNKKTEKKKGKEDEEVFDYILFLSLSFALFLLFYYFAVSDFSIHYVWENSGKDLDTYLKLTGVYAGQAGSILLWTFLMALSILVEDILRKYRTSKQKEVSDVSVHALSRIIALSVILIFLIILIVDDPFTPAHTFTIESIGPHGLEKVEINPYDYPEGNGMNPMLQNFWMVIHPPILFLGYAFSLLPFSYLLAKLIIRKEEVSALFWARLSWFFLTLGIGIGAIWAYVTLGWGGYWAWDPVETSSLIPWFTLTALIHSLLSVRRNGTNPSFPSIYATSSILLVLFATYVTRSGSWAQGSVHAWTESTTSNLILALMISIAFVSYGIIAYRYLTEKDDNENEKRDENTKEKNEKSKTGCKKDYLRTDYSNYLRYACRIASQICDACFAFIPVLLFVGMLVTRGSSSAPLFFETRLYPFLALVFIVIPFCATKLNRKRLLPLLAISLLSSLLIPFLTYSDLIYSPSKPFNSLFYSVGIFSISRELAASLLVAPSVFLIASSILGLLDLRKTNLPPILPPKTNESLSSKNNDKRKELKINKNKNKKVTKIKFYKAGSHIAHFGLGLLILGYILSSTWSYADTLEIETEKGFVGKYEFEKGEIHVEELPKKTIYTVDLIIYKDGSYLAKAKPKFVYYKELGRSIPEVEVINLVTEDVYIIINSLDPDRNGEIDKISFEIHVNIGMNLLWAGLLALALAILIRFSDPTETALTKISEYMTENSEHRNQEKDKIMRKEKKDRNKQENETKEMKKEKENKSWEIELDRELERELELRRK